MSIHILFSPPLRHHCDGQAEITVEATTLREAIDALRTRYAALAQKIFNDNGKRNPSVNIYVNEEDYRYLEDLATPLKDGDRVDFFVSVGGG